jgi:predicted transcriptional regulator
MRGAQVRRFSLTTTKRVVEDAGMKIRGAGKGLPRPTGAELPILRVLWDRGAATVREVHDSLSAARPTAYTTTLKLLQIMTEKGLVERDERDRSHVYRARIDEEQTQQQMVQDLLDRVFGGSAAKLVVQALSTRRAAPEELAQIREMLDRAEARKP